MGRSPCFVDNGLKKGPWTPEEDDKLIKYIQDHGHASWRALPELAAIASHLPGRTDNEIKNFWNTHLKKKLIQRGFDPMTHQPRTDIFSSLPHLIALANLHDNTWEGQAIKLQTELANLQYLHLILQNNSNLTTTNLTNDILNSVLTSSFKSSPVSNSIHSYETIPFDHLPNLQVSGQATTTSLNKEMLVQVPDHFTPVSNSDHQWLASSLNPTTAASPNISNSPSSYGCDATNSIWPDDLFEDPLFHELA
ncbi:hypothetical protein ACFE04_018925 [Oxalis oulophora]